MSNLKLIAAAAAVLVLTACSKSEAPAAAPLEITAGSSAAAVASSNAGIESCAKAVLAQAPGDLLQATLKQETEGRVWEFEIKQADGKLFDIECSDTAGTIVETEVRVATAADPAFAALAKIDEAAAKAKALESKPGTVERVEFELEPDGKASYEFDIKTADGDYRVEVDASSGEIVESSKELLEIGGV
ncbi:PepSY domain-containing protein [Nevskia ramosa]|uniref:PepSY domain-containing protein n=1 Tax=Nevskia ramosa TaxID=64002 RepID=UPI002355836A|nr:PepSY domain-containing protein [Nevskia ramosa]